MFRWNERFYTLEGFYNYNTVDKYGKQKSFTSTTVVDLRNSWQIVIFASWFTLFEVSKPYSIIHCPHSLRYSSISGDLGPQQHRIQYMQRWVVELQSAFDLIYLYSNCSLKRTCRCSLSQLPSQRTMKEGRCDSNSKPCATLWSRFAQVSSLLLVPWNGEDLGEVEVCKGWEGIERKKLDHHYDSERQRARYNTPTNESGVYYGLDTYNIGRKVQTTAKRQPNTRPPNRESNRIVGRNKLNNIGAILTWSPASGSRGMRPGSWPELPSPPPTGRSTSKNCSQPIPPAAASLLWLWGFTNTQFGTLRWDFRQFSVPALWLGSSLSPQL